MIIFQISGVLSVIIFHSSKNKYGKADEQTGAQRINPLFFGIKCINFLQNVEIKHKNVLFIFLKNLPVSKKQKQITYLRVVKIGWWSGGQ